MQMTAGQKERLDLFKDRNFRDSYWNPSMDLLGLEHNPHDARHTCASLLAEAGVDDRIIKK